MEKELSKYSSKERAKRLNPVSSSDSKRKRYPRIRRPETSHRSSGNSTANPIREVFNLSESLYRAQNGSDADVAELAHSYLLGVHGVKIDYQKALYWAEKGSIREDPLCTWMVVTFT